MIPTLPSDGLERGSSPRVWGKFLQAEVLMRVYIGSSPRVWGKWGSLAVGGTPVSGSSPRVWGKFKIHMN